MTAVDNSLFIRAFVPTEDDGDSFVYTELIDRSRNKGNNHRRVLHAFHHASREEFDDQIVGIKSLCDQTGTRAYTHLGHRSRRRVGLAMMRHVIEIGTSEAWVGMHRAYAHVCATTRPVDKYWMIDVDQPSVETVRFGRWLVASGHCAATIPSRDGHHYIVNPYRLDIAPPVPAGATLCREACTNLYIPDGAA